MTKSSITLPELLRALETRMRFASRTGGTVDPGEIVDHSTQDTWLTLIQWHLALLDTEPGIVSELEGLVPEMMEGADYTEDPDG